MMKKITLTVLFLLLSLLGSSRVSAAIDIEVGEGTVSSGGGKVSIPIKMSNSTVNDSVSGVIVWIDWDKDNIPDPTVKKGANAPKEATKSGNRSAKLGDGHFSASLYQLDLEDDLLSNGEILILEFSVPKDTTLGKYPLTVFNVQVLDDTPIVPVELPYSSTNGSITVGDEKKTYDLTVDSSGATGVSISSTTDHGGTTNYSKTDLASGTTVKLTAPASSGVNPFTSWSGSVSSTNRAISLSMTSDKTVTANYGDTPKTLTVKSSGATEVSISVSPADQDNLSNGSTEFDRTYADGTRVTLTAPSTSGGKAFTGWTGDTDSDTDGVTAYVTMTGAKTVTANYQVSDPPVLKVTPLTHDVGLAGGSVSSAVSNTGGGILTWKATVEPGKGWLSASPTGDQTGGGNITITCTANSGLSRTGEITVTAGEGVSGSPQTITVSQVGIQPIIETDKTSIDFGTETVSDVFDAWNSGTGTLNYTVSIIIEESSDCFSVEPPIAGYSTGSSNKNTHTVTVDREKIDYGATVTGTVKIVATQNGDETINPVEITLKASRLQPSIDKDKTLIDLGRIPVSDTLLVWNDGTGETLSYDLKVTEAVEGGDDAKYFSVSPKTGSAAGTGQDNGNSHTVSVEREDMTPGQTVEARLTISSENADDGPQDVVLKARRNIPPLVSIAEPITSATFANSKTSCEVSGTASDPDADGSVSVVECRVTNMDGESEWMTASGTTDWSITVDLAVGDNIIEARAQDDNPEYSEIATVVVFRLSPRGDLNGDGLSDLILMDRRTGIASLGLMEEGATTWTVSYSSDWRKKYDLIGTGDLNGDGRSDLLLKYRPSETVYICLVNETGSSWNVSYYSKGWYKKYSLLGVGDLNGDGRDDLILRYNRSGTIFFCLMRENGAMWDIAYTGNWNGYRLLGMPDLNGDGRADMILQFKDTGDAFFCLTNEDGSYWTLIAAVDWRDKVAIGTGDLNGDGLDDFVLRDNKTEEMSLCLINEGGDTWTVSQTIDCRRYTLKGIGDFNGDDVDDLILRHRNGTEYLCLMRPGGQTWDIAHVGKFEVIEGY